jgi:hypothetical protein
MRGKRHPRWRLLPLEMLSMYTCYSRLHWRWFGYMSPCYWTTWPSLVLAHFRFLMDHLSGPYCSTCQFSIGTRVVLWLGHVSFLHWTMCRIFIGPRGRFLFDHVSQCCPSMFCLFIRPCGLMTSFHMLDFYWPMCRAMAISCVMHWFVHVSHSYLITWPAQVLLRAQQSIHHKSNSRSSHCTDWLHNYSTMST